MHAFEAFAKNMYSIIKRAMNPFLLALLICVGTFFVMLLLGYMFYLGAGTASSLAANGDLNDTYRN
jgi:hypothetical protein